MMPLSDFDDDFEAPPAFDIRAAVRDAHPHYDFTSGAFRWFPADAADVAPMFGIVPPPLYAALEARAFATCETALAALEAAAARLEQTTRATGDDAQQKEAG